LCSKLLNERDENGHGRCTRKVSDGSEPQWRGGGSAATVSSGERMSKTFQGIVGLTLGVAMQGGLGGGAFAQVPVSHPAAATVLYAQAGSDQGDGPGFLPDENPAAADLPVLYVTSVEVLRTAVEPRLDVVRVTGLASSGGWGAPQLVPTYAGKPFDDVLDLQFIATPPAQSQNASGFVPVGAVFPLDPGQQLKGVRVRASENAITVKQIPGSREATVHVSDCKDCMGKKFSAEGSGQSPKQGVVRQEDLPKLLRLIRGSDGIRGTDLNPNRLTLILDDDNTIVEAFWE
jgi:hypothetical protein